MQFLQWLAAALTGWWGSRQSVGPHTRNQAYGPRWSKHRPRKIHQYHRRRPRPLR